jgi:hypothetical protein
MLVPRKLKKLVILLLITAGAVIRPNPSFAQERRPSAELV